MSEQRVHNNQMTLNESVADLRWIILWSENGSNWTSILRDECLAANDTTAEEDFNYTSKKLLLGLLVTLGFLGAVSWFLVQGVSQAVQKVSAEVNQKSVTQLVLKDYEIKP